MLWGSRFKTKLNGSAMEFSSSLPVDINLIEEDLLVNKAHTEMLEQIGIISHDEMKSIINGLKTIHKEFEDGSWKPNSNKSGSAIIALLMILNDETDVGLIL